MEIYRHCIGRQGAQGIAPIGCGFISMNFIEEVVRPFRLILPH